MADQCTVQDLEPVKPAHSGWHIVAIQAGLTVPAASCSSVAEHVIAIVSAAAALAGAAAAAAGRLHGDVGAGLTHLSCTASVMLQCALLFGGPAAGDPGGRRPRGQATLGAGDPGAGEWCAACVCVVQQPLWLHRGGQWFFGLTPLCYCNKVNMLG